MLTIFGTLQQTAEKTNKLPMPKFLVHSGDKIVLAKKINCKACKSTFKLCIKAKRYYFAKIKRNVKSLKNLHKYPQYYLKTAHADVA